MSVFCAKDDSKLFLYGFLGPKRNVLPFLLVLLNLFPHFLICTLQHELWLSRRSLTDLGDIFAAMATFSSIFVEFGDALRRQIMALY